eukprot:gene4589-9118_t
MILSDDLDFKEMDKVNDSGPMQYDEKYSMFIKLSINKNTTEVRKFLDYILGIYITIHVSGDIYLDNGHLEFAIVSEEDICTDFYKDLKDGLEAVTQNSQNCHVEVDSKVDVSVTPPSPCLVSNNKMVYSFIDISPLCNIIQGREKEFLKNLEERHQHIQLKWIDEELTLLDASSEDSVSLQLFENAIELLKLHPSTIDAFLNPVIPSSSIKLETFLDMTPLLPFIRGNEVTFITSMQNHYGVEVHWPTNDFTLLHASSTNNKRLEAFSKAISFLCSNPTVLRNIHTAEMDITPLLPIIQGHENHFRSSMQMQSNHNMEVSWSGKGLRKLRARSFDEQAVQTFEKQMNGHCAQPNMLPVFKFNIDVTAVRDLLTVKHIKYLERQYHVVCILNSDRGTNTCTLFCETLNEDVAIMFEAYIRNILVDPSIFTAEIERQTAKKIHLYVDVSNISIGIQKLNDGTIDRSIKLDISNLTDVVTNLRTVEAAVAVGSTGGGGSGGTGVAGGVSASAAVAAETPYWKVWTQNGFKTIILERGRQGEQAVDEVLHAQVSMEAHRRYREERTIVILTGDGNDNHSRGTSFPQIVEDAMSNGWTVEVWSWSRSTSRNYEIFKRNYYQRLYISVYALSSGRIQRTTVYTAFGNSEINPMFFDLETSKNYSILIPTVKFGTGSKLHGCQSHIAAKCVLPRLTSSTCLFASLMESDTIEVCVKDHVFALVVEDSEIWKFFIAILAVLM